MPCAEQGHGKRPRQDVITLRLDAEVLAYLPSPTVLWDQKQG
jgi:hypothetical protein